jgi:chromosome segregation ATPase
MDQGAAVVIKRLSRDLPQFFTNAPEVTTVENALEFVDRGAIMVYRCLDEQNKRIVQLTQDVVAYSQKIVNLEENIISANDTIGKQNDIISGLSLELGKIQDRFSQFTKLTESIKAQLETELDNARKEISELSRLRDSLQGTVEETQKRLKESEALLRIWTEVGESSKDTA